MKKQYWIILISYIAMQLLVFIGVPLFTYVWMFSGKSLAEAEMLALPTWLVFSFSITLIIVLFLLRKEMANARVYRNDQAASPLASFFWAFGGVFLALFAQGFAARIEQQMGIEVGSENTQIILQIIDAFPIVVIVTSIIGPILEEIVFRKIIFGSLYKRFNFFISALISSVIFSVAHNELEHTLLYAAMGFTFAFLYVKTKRIIVPIIAHVAMNTFVVLVQSVFYDDIQKLLEEMEQIQSIIGGL